MSQSNNKTSDICHPYVTVTSIVPVIHVAVATVAAAPVVVVVVVVVVVTIVVVVEMPGNR